MTPDRDFVHVRMTQEEFDRIRHLLRGSYNGDWLTALAHSDGWTRITESLESLPPKGHYVPVFNVNSGARWPAIARWEFMGGKVFWYCHFKPTHWCRIPPLPCT